MIYVFYVIKKMLKNVLKYVCSCFCFTRLLSTGFNRGGLSKKGIVKNVSIRGFKKRNTSKFAKN